MIPRNYISSNTRRFYVAWGSRLVQSAFATCCLLSVIVMGSLANAQAPEGPIISKLTSGSAWLFAPSHYSQAAAYGPDGSVYFTEFGKQRLMRLGPKGLEAILTNQPGLYGVAVDSKNRIYVGLDLSDNPSQITGKYQGSVNRVDFDASGRAYLKLLVDNIRRPRNLVTYGDRLYFIVEAERTIKSFNPDEVTTTGLPVVTDEFRMPIVDSANGLAIHNGRFYWAQYGQFADRNNIVGGAIRSTSMVNPGAITTHASGLGRARGVGFDAAGNLYFTTESNAQDQGNSGMLGKISPDGKLTTVIDNLDYPQFLAVSPGGSIMIPFCRENYIAILHQDTKNVSIITPYPGIELFGVGLGARTSTDSDTTLTITLNDFGRTLNFPVSLDEAKGRGGWVTIPFDSLINSLGVSKEQLNPYTIELPYPVQPEVPAPGFFKKPSISCTVAGKQCTAVVISKRTHVSWRWPMTGAEGHERPPPGFSESPDAFLVNFYW